jgi:ATP-dependent Clp protease adaptor protein ClpS
MAEHFTREDIFLEEVVETAQEVDASHELIIYNDDVNTFDWVIVSLMEICDHSSTQAEQCTLLVHFKGKASVKHGNMTNLKPMRQGLVDRGISATIE